jgi:oligopeptide/dipeptide ABC transporter ATP-binding protein
MLTSHDSLMRVEDLCVSFSIRGAHISAVEQCSFSLLQGKTLGIVGESGCGKSVTSLALMGLLPSNGKYVSGKIEFEKKNLISSTEREWRSLRGSQISMIFQEPMTSLNPVFTIGDQVSEMFRMHWKLSAREARQEAIRMLEQVHIPDASSRYKNYPHQLSGGMRQRVMIAIALSCQPKILIADEPTTALDVTIQAQILQLINHLQEKNKMATLLITHDLGVVAESCDDVMVMYAGKIVEKTSVQQLFQNPLHPYTQGLLASVPVLGKKQSRLFTIPGMVPSLEKRSTVGCRFRDRCPVVMDQCAQEDPVLSSVLQNHQVACFRAVPKESFL